MGHTSELRWGQAAGEVTTAAREILEGLDAAERIYLELLEAYQYTGGTDQSFADQLFKEEWEARTQPGTVADITVDVVSGVVTTATLVSGGAGYNDGVGFSMTLLTTAGGGDGAAVLSYDVVNGAITNVTVFDGGTTYTDGNGQAVSDIPAPGVVPETEANADEVAKAADHAGV